MTMPARLTLAVFALLAATVPWAAPVLAQNETSPIAQPGVASPAPPRHRGRITIYPGRLLYRSCTDWYELQYRPSGTVLYPQMRCWWVRG
jgi:hypothetical protein